MEPIPVADRAAQIEYAIRDVVVPATELEKQGHKILKLNIGDPLAYPGLPTPTHMIKAFQESLGRQENGYSHSYGIPQLRQAIATDEQSKGWACTEDDVYVCHGVTEALQIVFAAVLQEGDKVLSPGPHYPPYMTYPPLFGGSTIEYRMDSQNGWYPDLDDIRAKMDDSVRLLVLINPNNPTGGIADERIISGIIEIAAEWPNCIIIADEIYDGLNFEGNHISMAGAATSAASPIPVLTMNGVSKVYYAPGWRIGYMAFYDPAKRLSLVRDGIERLLRARLCASTPAQMGYLAGLTSDDGWMDSYRQKLLQQRDYCMQRISSIDGLQAQTPGGAFYLFIELTHPRWREDDKQFVLDLLHQEKVLMVHGSGFSPEFGKGFVRMVYLPDIEVLEDAFDRIERFLSNS
ncbi:MAG: alanine aminotransferase [Methanobacteriota archaeon]|jgi:aspartate/methionine/tyrosine aminotransferase|nr:MAG: alanine aminotransferase [Euryarchaeota archaeon]HIG19619.1 aminotransferase class I/II-fold pyridoxal phosphate-dependent enzyme [Candidatus Poseidoniales archaeon]